MRAFSRGDNEVDGIRFPPQKLAQGLRRKISRLSPGVQRLDDGRNAGLQNPQSRPNPNVSLLYEEGPAATAGRVTR